VVVCRTADVLSFAWRSNSISEVPEVILFMLFYRSTHHSGWCACFEKRKMEWRNTSLKSQRRIESWLPRKVWWTVFLYFPVSQINHTYREKENRGNPDEISWHHRVMQISDTLNSTKLFITYPVVPFLTLNPTEYLHPFPYIVHQSIKHPFSPSPSIFIMVIKQAKFNKRKPAPCHTN